MTDVAVGTEVLPDADIKGKALRVIEDDIETKGVVAFVDKVEGSVAMVVMAVVVFHWLFGIISADGGGERLFAALFGGFIDLIAFGVISTVIGIVVFVPLEMVKFGRCRRAIRAFIDTLPMVKPEVITWESPRPGAIAVDPASGCLFIELDALGYRRILLKQKEILWAKVEREATVHTTTKKSATRHIMWTSSFATSHGGSSKSETKVVETAFLEVAFQAEGSYSPEIFVIPFRKDRREAERWAFMIETMKAASA